MALSSFSQTPTMGVAVQRMVDAEVAGVLFTCNPVSGDRSVGAIEASWGLGISVVGGEVTPDEYLVSKVTGEIVRSVVNPKLVEHRLDPADSFRCNVTTPCGDSGLRALVTLGRGDAR